MMSADSATENSGEWVNDSSPPTQENMLYTNLAAFAFAALAQGEEVLVLLAPKIKDALQSRRTVAYIFFHT